MNKTSTLRKACSLGLSAWLLVATPAPTAIAQTLKVGGTGSSAPLLTLLFNEFRKTRPEATLSQVSPPLGSGAALKALASGRIDLALIGRPLNPEERTGVGQHFSLATTPTVLASSDGRKKDGFTADELAAVYAGTLAKWDDGAPIRLILRASFEADTLALKALSPTLAAAVDAAAQRPGMAMGQDDLDTLELLVRTPGSLAPTSLGLLTTTQTTLRVFALNRVTPTLTTLKDGSYPWRKELIVVLPQQATPLAEQFAAFLRSERVAALLRRYDYLPAKP